MKNCVDPDRCHILQHLIWVYTVCKSLSVPILLDWLAEVKVSCSFCHRGTHLILAYSWAKPAVLAKGKGRVGMLLFLLFLHFLSVSLSSLSLSFISSTISFLPFSGRLTQNDSQGLTCR